MSQITERSLGYGFGLLGGVLIGIAAILSLVVGAVDLVAGRGFGAINAGAEAIVLFVVAGLAVFFAYLAHTAWSNRPLASGVMLVVIAAIGWAVLGLGTNVIAVIGAIFVFLAGILFLVEPTRSAVASVTTA